MNYQETIEFLYSALPVFQRDGKSAFKKDLNNIITLCEALGNPQNSFKSIHIAGTNGKGSLCHILSATLQTEGYKVGLYTSPHLLDFRERIKSNGEVIKKEQVVDFVAQIQPLIDELKPSFFEITVAMAFHHFQQEKVDIAVVETGLGGRLDSTNILSPILSIITNISYDHMDMLGDTLEEIAEEKAGIIKANTPFVVGQANEACDNIFDRHSKEKNAAYYKAWQIPMTLEYNRTDLTGPYQYQNINLSKIVIGVLNDFLPVDINNWRKAIQNVKELTGLRGRWEVIQESGPRIICDTGHNEAGFKSIVEGLKHERFKTLHYVLGIVKEKDLKVLSLLPKLAQYYFCKPAIFRGLDEHTLADASMKFGLAGKTYSSVANAYEAALSNAAKEDLLFVGGSTFVVAELLELLES